MKFLGSFLIFLSKIWYYIIDNFLIYPTLALLARKLDIHFMNLGYVPKKNEKRLSVFNRVIEVETNQRAHCYLYEKALSMCPLYHKLQDKTLLEVGCGHGAGLRWIKRSHPEIGNMYGIDIVIVDDLKYKDSQIIQGNAEKIPFPDEQFDILINIESSHLYNNFPAFVEEAYRVLKKNSYIVWADLRFANEIKEKCFNIFENVGFKLIQVEDITKQVLNGMEVTSKRYDELLKQSPWFIQLFSNSIRETYCAPGTKSFNRFKRKEKIYMIAIWKKD
uniref:Methyltransf_11 domain-containing protein n=1 Tax=Strongyloides stercoralis TaxID=6248 RepID=A0A0K0DU68_STRER